MIEPRICWVPPSVGSLGREAVEFAASYGVVLDDWQDLAMDRSLAVREDGRWAAFEVGVNVARQNGKNELAIARELAGLFLFGERLIIHSAHEFKTSTEHQRRLEEIIQDSPELVKRLKGGDPRKAFTHSHGQEAIELRDGARIRFMTRTKGGGRGHVGDLVVMDEAMILPAAMMGALMPTMSARSMKGNPQLWYLFTAVDRMIQEHGLHVARIRERGMAGDDPSLAYLEWSIPVNGPDEVTDEMISDPAFWAMANPSMDIRISREHIANELRSLDRRTFIIERLGGGDYPSTSGEESVIDLDRWADCLDEHSKVLNPVAFAFDLTPQRSAASICAAGSREDGLRHAEVIDHRRGTGWVIDRLLELDRSHRPSGIFCAAGSPAESLVPALDREGLKVVVLSSREHALACGLIFDLVEQKGLRHLGTLELAAALGGAVKRPLGDAWAWSRTNSGVDISPLVAVTLALFGHQSDYGYRGGPMAAFV